MAGLKEYDSGLKRSDNEGKVDYTHCLDGPMLERWAWHMTKNVPVYGGRNWMKATPADESRFEESLLRHVIQYIRGEDDEDHAAAIMYNVNGLAYIRDQKVGKTNPTPLDDEFPWVLGSVNHE